MGKRRRVRFPNGYGSISKQSGKRRKPWLVRITAGWELNHETGKVKQIMKCIGYFATESEAMKALAEYNANPYDINSGNITFHEMFEKFIEMKKTSVDEKTYKGYIYSFKRCQPLHFMKFADIKTYELQTFFQGLSDVSSGTVNNTKSLIKQLFKYAMELDIITKDYSEFIKTGKYKKVIKRSIFTAEEIAILWANINEMEYVNTILILIYTGMRVGELLSLKKNNVDLINCTLTGGSKTEAGKNRIIPIHPKILPLITELMKNPTDYLITNAYGTGKISYNNYLEKKFYRIMEKLGMNHKPHDTRYTFATMMSDVSDGPTAIKTIIGHKFFDTTEKIYIQKDIERLRNEIDKLN